MLCLLKSQIEKIQQDFKDKGIVFRPSDYMNLDGDEITEKLRPIVGENAEGLSELIQQKLILQNRIRGLELLRDKINEQGKYSPSRVESAKDDIAEYKQKNLERIMNPKEHESFLSSLAARITGAEPTREQAKTVFDMSKKIEDLKAAPKEGPGSMAGTSVELFNAQKELSDYMNSLNEKPAYKSLLDSAASLYKNLFIGVKTGIKNATFGIYNSTLELINRRIAAGMISGDVDISLKKEAAADNLKFFSKTGDINFIKTSLDDHSVFGDSTKGNSENFGGKDTIKEGPLKPAAEAANVAARAAKVVAIDALHRGTMAALSTNFVDALDIRATQFADTPLAKSLGMDANAIFKDAVKIEPETEVGKLARANSQQELFRILNINNTVLSEMAIDLQKRINSWTPNVHVGDYLIPMAKVPSSAVYNGIENMGGGLGTGLFDVVKGTSDLKKLGANADPKEQLESVEQIRNGTRTLIRTFGTITAALIITANLNKKDFKAPDEYGNSYIKMGDLWLSTDAFGQLGPAITGTMMAKTENTGAVENYGEGAFTELQKAPAVSDINSSVVEGSKGKLASGIISSFFQPVLYNDLQKSAQEKSVNPFLFGTLVRTQAQVTQEDKANQKKSVASRIKSARNKTKPQKIF